MLGHDDCYFVCMHLKTVPFRQVYNSAHKSEDLDIDCFPENEIRNRWSNGMFLLIYCGVEQRSARRSHKPEVPGSNPGIRNKLR